MLPCFSRVGKAAESKEPTGVKKLARKILNITNRFGNAELQHESLAGETYV
jgi:hypothetical protein